MPYELNRNCKIICVHLSRMLHVLKHRCHTWLNALSQPLQLSHFFTVATIFVAAKLGFQS